MAHDNMEIEIVVQLDREMFSEVRGKVKGICKFVKTSKQVDEYLTPKHKNFVEPKYPFEWLSIRERGEKVILNYKHFYPEHEEEQTHGDEFETEVKNIGHLRKIFEALEFKKLVTVEKERENYTYRDEFDIALDNVKGLGTFIEIEAIKDFGGIKATRKKVFEFAESLGIDVEKRNNRGYAYLLMQKEGLVK